MLLHCSLRKHRTLSCSFCHWGHYPNLHLRNQSTLNGLRVKPWCRVHLRYLKILFTALKCVFNGQFMNCETLLTIKAMSGLVMVTYCKAPTILRDSWGLWTGLPFFEEILRLLSIGVGRELTLSMWNRFRRSYNIFLLRGCLNSFNDFNLRK